MILLRALLLFFLFCLACSSPATEPIPPGTGGIASEDLGLMRAVSWPGGGSELTVFARTSDTPRSTTDLSGLFTLSLGDASEPSFSARRSVLPPGYTGILVDVPSTNSDQRELEQELLAFIETRPTEESIGLFLRRESVDQLASFTSDRERLRRAIGRISTLGSVTTPMPMPAAMQYALAETLSVGGKGPSVMRALVLATLEPTSPIASAIPVLHGLDRASLDLQELADNDIYKIAICAPSGALDLSVRNSNLLGDLQVPLPTTPTEDQQLPCSQNSIASEERSYPDRLELLFTASQREAYESRVSALSTDDFDLSVRVGDNGVAIASAHLRGKGTLGCERKSYTLRFDGPGRQFFPESHTDEFYLLSMCADERYVEQYSANQLMAELGLFSLKFRYIELLLDSEQKGVYLMLEKAREEIVRDSSRVRSVMRRRFDVPDDLFEVKYTEGDSSPEASYARVIEGAARLEDHLDLEQYLRFLATMSAFKNGDYIDEIWIRGTETLNVNAMVDSYFSMMAWDNDDLFSECHYSGQHAFVDPHELAYCAEADIDARLLSDPIMYERFVDILEKLLTDDLTPERFDQALQATSTAIMPFLDRPGLSAALVRLVDDNPAAVDPQEAKRDVREHLDSLASSYRARRDLLLARIQSYRESQQ